MDESTYKRLKDWVFENHEHHGTVDNNYNSDDEWSNDASDDTICYEGNYPYVNSMLLEGFIDSLVDPSVAAKYQYKG